VTADQVLPKQAAAYRPAGAGSGWSTTTAPSWASPAGSGEVAQLRRDLSGGVAWVTVPQVHPVGQQAEVDVGGLWVWLDATLPKGWLVVLRPGRLRVRRCSWRSPARPPSVFLEGHVLAVQALGGCRGGSAPTTCGPGVDRILQGPGPGPGTSDASP
jgi:hypothetical protein